MNLSKEEILTYHLGGKIGVQCLKSLKTQRDLSVAYTPGVALACNTIKDNPDAVYQYTCKNNLVAVVTDGTAVLGLGDIGAKASIPVMEGKAVLFKAFAGVDAWPVPLEFVRTHGKTGTTDAAKVIDAVAALSPMYGGINLEDIAAPACFEIEQKLDEMLEIPVFHDDQWGTAVISLAAMENYCIISKKHLPELSIVVNGAGAAGIRISDMLKEAGATRILLCDSKGVIRSDRSDLNDQKRRYAVSTGKQSLADAMKEADVFIGVSVKNCVTADMVRSMREFPGIFAMANPDPEITPAAVYAALGKKPYVMATGRSDYPNQINNVLGFPHIFRGALDVRSRTISMNMKKAAASALAQVARMGKVSAQVKAYYGKREFDFGTEYLVPLPMDKRVAEQESAAVSQAALKDGNSVYCRAGLNGPLVSPESDKEIEGCELIDFSYIKGVVYAHVQNSNGKKIIPISSKIEIEDLLSHSKIKTVKLDLTREAGKFFRLASNFIGCRKIASKKHSIGKEKNIACFTGETGWKR